MAIPPGARIGAYEVIGLLGSGGMGEVYRARDLRLKRDVAIKRLRRDAAGSPEAVRRMLTEAQAVARLDHPNICGIHEAGEDADGPFIVMPLVEGETLTALLRHGPLSIERSMDIARQIAAALAAAHGKGVLHRDVKPANVMVDASGRVRVMDFGLATFLRRPDDDSGSEETVGRLTMPGTTLGTVAYMSPEQARGQTLDARSDLFSVGAVLYELLTGHQPFRGSTPADVIAALISREPSALSAERPAVPAVVERIVVKALAKHPSDRYPSADQLLADIDGAIAARHVAPDVQPAGRDSSISTPRSERPDAKRRRAVWIAGALAVVIGASILAWVLVENRPDALPRAVASSGPARVVVLPFENLSRQPQDDWLAGAFADALTAGLQVVPALVLVPRERVVELYTARSLQDSQRLDPAVTTQLSARLQVRYYVHGGYQRVGDELRVVARLVDADAGEIRKQETATGQLGHVLALQDTLAQQLVADFGGPDRPVGGPVAHVPSLDAYQAVGTARRLYAVGRLDDARPLLEQAVQQDPEYGDAWAWLSKTLSRQASPANFAGGSIAPFLERARDAAATALKANPDLYEGHVAAALASRGFGDVTGLRASASRAVALTPSHAEALTLMADSYSASPACFDQDWALAERLYRDALQLDPLGASTYVNFATHLDWMDRGDEAVALIDRGIAALPESRLLSDVRPSFLIFANRLSEADRLLETQVRSDNQLKAVTSAELGKLAAARGDLAEAARRVKAADEAGLTNVVPRVSLWAQAYFLGGHPKEGAALLERSFALQPCTVAWAVKVPGFAKYRRTPEFVAALAKHGVR